MGVTALVTRQIANLAITTGKIAANAITLAKLGIFTAKGDIVSYDGASHNALAVGTDGKVLTADAASTNGIKWNTPFSATNFISNETPTGTVDGSNTNFVLANTPVSGTEKVYVNGIRNHSGAGNDYTISTATITFLSGAIPQTGDVILVDYQK